MLYFIIPIISLAISIFCFIYPRNDKIGDIVSYFGSLVITGFLFIVTFFIVTSSHYEDIDREKDCKYLTEKEPSQIHSACLHGEQIKEYTKQI